MQKLLIIAILYSPSAFAETIYPSDASQNAIAVDRLVKSELGKSKCMFVDSETGKCSMQSVYNGGSDGAGGGGAGSAGGSAGSSGGSSGGGSSGGSGSGGSSGSGGTGGCK